MKSSAIRFFNASCSLGTDLDSCVDRLLNANHQPVTESFPRQRDPVTMPYFALPYEGERPSATDIIYNRLQQLAEQALQACALGTAERQRTGLFFGSSSFDVAVSEQQYRQQLDGEQPQHAVPMPIVGYGKLAQSTGQKLGLSPYRFTYSTACTSSANALLYAHRMLQSGVIDHALVMGFEFFNETTLLGFHGLGLISPGAAMQPFAAGRDGLILGEGCGVIVLSRDYPDAPLQLRGGAVATDNHSLTAANSDGSSLASVINQALDDSHISATDIVAVKAHGTASLMNDEAEAAGLKRIFPQKIPPAFALKPFCGHTLGACGALEMALTLGCLARGFLPANPQAVVDPQLGIQLLPAACAAPDGHYLFNCFAFGGNNNALILQRRSL